MKLNSLLALCVATTVVAAAPVSHADTITVSQIGAITTIQGGLDAASAGDTVVVRSGTYFGPSIINLGKDGLTLKGVGKVVLDARPPGGLPAGAGLIVLSSNVTVTGITFRNAASIQGNPGDGIRSIGNNLTVKKCAFLDQEESGIDVTATTTSISNCRFAGNNQSIRMSSTVGATIRDCFCNREDDDAIVLLNTTDTSIENCSFLLIEDGPIIDASDGNGNNGLVVRKCKFENADGEAASVTGANFVFENNRVLHTGGGVEVSGNNPTIRKNTFNKMVDDADAVFCDTAATGLIELNAAKDVPDEFIILASTASNFVVRHNRVFDCCCEDELAFDIRGNGHLLEDNVAIDIGGDAFNISGDGIELVDCVAKNCLRDGFDIVSGTGNALTNCVARNCIAEGVDNSGTATVLTRGSANDCRIDLVNSGTLTLNGFEFATGGANSAPQID